MPLIGLAEDDLKIAELIKVGLEEQGYDVITTSNGQEAIAIFKDRQIDLVILDVLMPGSNGMEVCKILRTSDANLPILMLTAMGSLDDKITGFNSGADDYLLKPFHFKELLARIEALLRRTISPKIEHTSILSYDDLQLNTLSKEVLRGNVHIELTAKEYALLEIFIRHPNQLLSRQFLAEHAWDVNFDTGTNVVDVYVNFLRNKIEKGFNKKLIHTRINMGYILK